MNSTLGRQLLTLSSARCSVSTLLDKSLGLCAHDQRFSIEATQKLRHRSMNASRPPKLSRRLHSACVPRLTSVRLARAAPSQFMRREEGCTPEKVYREHPPRSGDRTRSALLLRPRLVACCSRQRRVTRSPTPGVGNRADGKYKSGRFPAEYYLLCASAAN